MGYVGPRGRSLKEGTRAIMQSQRNPAGSRKKLAAWFWWLLAGVLTASLATFAIVSWLRATDPEDPEGSQIGKIYPLNRSAGVAVSKEALRTILQSRSTYVVAQLIGAAQVFTPREGTKVKLVYTELLQGATVYQVVIEDGRYKGRSGWVIERQIRWPFASKPKSEPSPADDVIDEPVPTPVSGSGDGSGSEPPDGH